MAYATDYASRVQRKWDQTAFVKQQTVAAIRNLTRAAWTAAAIKSFCLETYSHMGLTEALYEKLLDQ
jgi:hypothetical protein